MRKVKILYTGEEMASKCSDENYFITDNIFEILIDIQSDQIVSFKPLATEKTKKRFLKADKFRAGNMFAWHKV